MTRSNPPAQAPTAERQRDPVVASQRDADQLVDGIVGVMGQLDEVVGRETDLLRSYKLRDAAAMAAAKTEAAKNYVHALERLKANAIALARWSPAAVQRLKTAQGRLAETLNINMAVLATARSVSEGIIRNLATEVAAPRTLTTYGSAGRATTSGRPSATPLMVSRNL
jgi:hypothetical protein